MPISEKQREQRRTHVGSSDAATILGFCPTDDSGEPYSTRYDVWAQKHYATAPDKTSAPAELGNILEDAILEQCARRVWGYHTPKEQKAGVSHGARRFAYRRNQRRVEGRVAANVDAAFRDLIDGRKCCMEAKSTGRWQEWGDEDWSDTTGRSVPPHVLIQAQAHCYAGGFDRCYVAVLLPGYKSLEHRVYPVDRDDELIALMVQEIDRFWTEHVEPGVPPEDISHTAVPILQRVLRVPEKVVPIEAGVVEAWESAKVAEKAAILAAKEARAIVLDQVGNAEAGDYGDPDQWLTYFQNKRGVRTLRTQKKK
ncbi:MAG: hypothetical protein DHS20C21_19320 [Gemmatimonadota bacterium]|nr:MAG: hypothetical protein DHS20C21_19320 [Gemmatimonadota bacterium]